MDTQEHNPVDDPLVQAHLKKKSNGLPTQLYIIHMKHDSKVIRRIFINYGIKYLQKHQ
jgi:hypothetical protein